MKKYADMRSEFMKHLRPGEQLDKQVLEIEAKRSKLKVGTFELNLDSNGFGSVTIDGQPLPLAACTIKLRAGYVPRIIAKIVAPAAPQPDLELDRDPPPR